MVTVETSLRIDRPADEVFAFLVDQTNGPRWQHGLLEVRRVTPGPVRVGTEHEFRRRFAGRTLVSRNRYLELDPGRFVRFGFGSTIGADGVGGEGSYRVEATGQGACMVTSQVTLAVQGVGGWFGPIVRRALVRDTARDERTLKSVLEGDPDLSSRLDPSPRT